MRKKRPHALSSVDSARPGDRAARRGLAERDGGGAPARGRSLAGVRRSGVAAQRNRSEPGVSAVGISLGDTGPTPAALSVSMPTLRFDPTDVEHWVGQLRTTARDIRDVLAREMAARAGTGA